MGNVGTRFSKAAHWSTITTVGLKMHSLNETECAFVSRPSVNTQKTLLLRRLNRCLTFNFIIHDITLRLRVIHLSVYITLYPLSELAA